jgi:hypothetical protein
LSAHDWRLATGLLPAGGGGGLVVVGITASGEQSQSRGLFVLLRRRALVGRPVPHCAPLRLAAVGPQNAAESRR